MSFLRCLLGALLVSSGAAWRLFGGAVPAAGGLGARRARAAAAVAAALALQPGAALAETYSNERYHTQFEIPKGWTSATGVLSGERKVEAWIDPTDAGTSVSLVFTPIPADFTRLTSFGGGKETLREYLVPRGEGIDAKIIDETIKGETYTLEYVVSAPEQPTRHITTAFALRPAESVVGLTVQTAEDTYKNKEAILKPIIPSLKIHVNEE